MKDIAKAENYRAGSKGLGKDLDEVVNESSTGGLISFWLSARRGVNGK